jgi:NAD(P)-dependent dehydrogenase (short-subunit alcohol dehydrogenase family)
VSIIGANMNYLIVGDASGIGKDIVEKLTADSHR